MEKRPEASAVPKDAEKQIRGAFPRLPLKKILELTEAIFNEGHGEPVRRRTAFEKIGRSPESSASYILLSAANNGYGLIKGNKNSTHLELTGSAVLISNSDISEKKRLPAIYDLLFSNSYFASIIDRYKDKPMPSDQIVIDYFIRDQKLNQQDAETCWGTIKENINDYYLIEEVGNKKIILDKEYALTKIGSEAEPTEGVKRSNEPIAEDVVKEYTANGASGKPKFTKITPQVTFNIQIVLPESATPETYEAIFASMANHLLGGNGE